MTLKKIFYLVTTLLFSAFAYVQINDDDGTRWILIYGIIIIVSLLGLFGKEKLTYSAFTFSFFLAYVVLSHNLLMSWINEGKPAFIDYEPTNIEAVENIREYFGLVLCLIFSLIILLINYYSQKRKGRRTP